ncbi:MAG: GNAT family N-acetyltransferase [Phycisphaerales bacterium]|nr:GNAT family N-acetyltransferase [Phycisphaerales bacterium]
MRLEPLDADAHAEDLARAMEVQTLRYLYTWTAQPGDVQAFRDHIDRQDARGNGVRFAVVLLETGKAIGSTSYLDIHAAHRGLEIGSTWINSKYQRTKVNPEMKYLMLRHAFETDLFPTGPAIRVQLKTDMRNMQSQRAIEKLGAVREGVLRKAAIMHDGWLRDSVVYSITQDEWPAVKAKLETRI